MIEGRIAEGCPMVILEIGGREVTAIVDTGFNGDLELPESLRDCLDVRYVGPMRALLAGGLCLHEDLYEITIEFDGEEVVAETTFVGEGAEVLLGTRLLRNHRLEVDFPAGTVRIQRLATVN